jgi:hypothetical protein
MPLSSRSCDLQAAVSAPCFQPRLALVLCDSDDEALFPHPVLSCLPILWFALHLPCTLVAVTLLDMANMDLLLLLSLFILLRPKPALQDGSFDQCLIRYG